MIRSSGRSPVYDAEGNNTEDGQGQTLVYDAWNRMVAIKVGSTVKIAYEYDGLFRRIQETVGTTVHSQYYSASWQVIEERVDDEVRVQNVWSAVYIDAMVLRDRDSDLDTNHTLDERVYPLFDANFTVSSIVDEEGAVLERYRYEPYGDRVVLNADFTPDTLAGSDSTTADDTEAGWNTSDVLFRHGHQGGAYDRVASEKMLFRFRTLDTQQMRWGSTDPLHYQDQPNLYQAYRNNPIYYVDPSGLSVEIVRGVRNYGTTVKVTLNNGVVKTSYDAQGRDLVGMLTSSPDRSITELRITGHGDHGGMSLGADVITTSRRGDIEVGVSSSEVVNITPLIIQKMADNAVVVRNGCHTGSDPSVARPGKLNAFSSDLNGGKNSFADKLSQAVPGVTVFGHNGFSARLGSNTAWSGWMRSFYVPRDPGYKPSGGTGGTQPPGPVTQP